MLDCLFQNGYIIDYTTNSNLAGIAIVHTDSISKAESILKTLGSFSTIGYKIHNITLAYKDRLIFSNTANKIISEVITAKGLKGDRGLTGPRGLKGDTGKQGLQGELGLQGEQGPQGLAGESGKSAYLIAVDNGFEGTELEWINSLGNNDTLKSLINYVDVRDNKDWLYDIGYLPLLLLRLEELIFNVKDNKFKTNTSFYFLMDLPWIISINTPFNITFSILGDDSSSIKKDFCDNAEISVNSDNVTTRVVDRTSTSVTFELISTTAGDIKVYIYDKRNSEIRSSIFNLYIEEPLNIPDISTFVYLSKNDNNVLFIGVVSDYSPKYITYDFKIDGIINNKLILESDAWKRPNGKYKKYIIKKLTKELFKNAKNLSFQVILKDKVYENTINTIDYKEIDF